MTVLVVGGTGFIARHLCQRLHALGVPGATVSYNPSLSFLEKYAPSIRGVEIESRDALEAFAEADVLIHVAHRSRPSSHPDAPQLEVESNVAAASKLFRDVLEVNPKCHIVYVSSGGQVYGSGWDTPIPEEAAAAPVTTYGFGKHLIEQTLGYFVRSLGASATILRVGNPVGRWQLEGSHGLVAAAVLLAGFADPERRRAGLYNIGSGVGLTECEIIDMVSRVTGKPVTFRHAPARGFDLRYAVLDTARARRELGWKNEMPLEEAVRKLQDAMEWD